MDTRRKLEELIQATLDLSPGSYSFAQDLAESQIDSFSLYNLVFAIEDTFSITLPDEGLDEVKTLAALEALIATRLSAAPEAQD